MGVIYAILNLKNNKRYIGSTANHKKRVYGFHRPTLRHGHHFSRHLQASFDKYGEEAFDFNIVLETVESEDLLAARERYWIEYYDAANPARGYNINKNPEASPMKGRKQSEEAKALISEASKRHWNDQAKRDAKAAQQKLRWSADPVYVAKMQRGAKKENSRRRKEALGKFGPVATARGWKIRRFWSMNSPCEATCPRGHKTSPLPNNLLRAWRMGASGCDECKPLEISRKMQDNIREDVRDAFLLAAEERGWIIGEYKNTREPCAATCPQGHVCQVRPFNIQRAWEAGDTGCRACSRDRVVRRRRKEFVADAESRGWRIIVYCGIQQPCGAICPDGHLVNPLPTNLLRAWRTGASGCNECYHLSKEQSDEES